MSEELIELTDFDYVFKLADLENTLTHQDFLDLRTQVHLYSQKFLIFVWSDLWLSKQKVIESKIKHLVNQSIKIHARQTKIIQISIAESESFMNENHLFNPIKGFKRYGLIRNQKVVAIAVFAKRRKFRDDSYSSELLMFSTSNNIHVNGGLSKLISQFRKDYPIKTLMTYVDLDWSEGDKFNTIGFQFVSKLAPQYFLPAKLFTKRIPIVEKIQGKSEVFNMGSSKFILTFDL